jgi:hypothetical protein
VQGRRHSRMATPQPEQGVRTHFSRSCTSQPAARNAASINYQASCSGVRPDGGMRGRNWTGRAGRRAGSLGRPILPDGGAGAKGGGGWD